MNFDKVHNTGPAGFDSFVSIFMQKSVDNMHIRVYTCNCSREMQLPNGVYMRSGNPVIVKNETERGEW